MSGEYEFEPVRGLPENLPAGETMLWQGSPDWKTLALRALHIRATGLYFAVLLAWYVEASLGNGESASAVLLTGARLAALALGVIGLMVLYSRLSARSTVYTITSRRVVIRAGIALPMVLNLPFAKIESADLKTYADGSGDIAVTLLPSERISYLFLWPHVQPWRLARARPMFRGIPEAARAAQILGRAAAAAGTVQQAPIREPAVSTTPASPLGQRPRAAAIA